MAFVSAHRKVRHRVIANDHDDSLLRWACALEPRHSAYIWMRWDNLAAIPRPKSLITWVKPNHSMGDLQHEHGRQTEVCAFFAGIDHHFPRGRPNDVVRAPTTGNPDHPTQKPVGLMCQVIDWTDGVVLDPFMGSGTTLVAAARMGRRAIGIELDPKYFKVACRRVAQAALSGDLFAAE
jgi:DNA modification methylase